MIGILAGMGPKSTGPFVDQVVASFQSLTGAKEDMDFPPMMIYALPTPFYVNRPIDHLLMEKTICGGLKKLEACGAAFIAMPCNTAHLYFAELERCIHIPLLNIVTATISHIPQSAKKITLLATRPTLESQIYQKGLHDAQITCVLHAAWQTKIDEMLLSIKSAAPLSVAIRLWDDLANHFLEAGIDTILLACTDLNVVLKAVNPPFQVIDSAACLSEAVVKKWQELKK
jgi:aspartate racemase